MENRKPDLTYYSTSKSEGAEVAIESQINKIRVEENARIHDKIATRYAKMHGEIYNDVEQIRLRKDLSEALSHIRKHGNICAVDFGCGAGNLTNHLLQLNCKVIACDISENFLKLIKKRYSGLPVSTVRLNGIDLANIPSESVDFVATYSVLHHVPDYIRAVREFMRILRPGGIIYIDHEPSPDFWDKTDQYLQFTAESRRTTRRDFRKYFVLTNYIDYFIRRFINPRFQREGDIHVFDDDHVEWDEIRRILNPQSGEILVDKSYLLFRRGYNINTFMAHMERTSDMHLLVFRKHG